MSAAARPSPPNILFLMPDQWRGMDFGAGGNAQIRTPNIDRLARQGVQFTGAVANCPVCTPARGILLTGKYAHSIGVPANDIPLPDGETTIAETLRERGYYTGFIGKWHLEGGKRLPGFVAPGPRRQGFEFWAANICHHDYLRNHYFRDNPKPIPIPGYEVFTWTDLAIEFLENAKRRAKPFCLYVWYGPPHDPYLEPPGYEKLYDPAHVKLRPNWKAGAPRFGTRADIAAYWSAITCLDAEMGRLVNRMDELGLGENTITLIASDHGDMLGSHGMSLKRKPWEESVRVPAIFRWPAGLEAGRRSGEPLSHVDIVPTLLGLAGARARTGRHGFDGAAYLRGRSAKTPEFAHLQIYTKTENGQYPPWRGLRNGKWKYARNAREPWVLYDLENDPYELSNLVAEPAQRRRIEQFDRLVEWQMRSTGDNWKEMADRPYR
jgi:arylsulfatase A-like enzyme